MSSLVAKGNTIHVPAQFLGGDQGKKITVSWSQNLKSRSAEFWICKYTVKSGGKRTIPHTALLAMLIRHSGSSSGVIFVQANKLDEFKAKKTAGEEFTLEIDDSFQYGQDKALTKRFLVYHDKGNKPYQVRP